MIAKKNCTSEWACGSAMLRDDLTLVAAVRGGDERAFVELVRRHSAKMLRMAYRVTKNPQDAEDATQDAFLNAYVHLDKFDGRAQFSTWLIRIGINSALMIVRRRGKRLEISIEGSSGVDSSRIRDVVDTSVDTEAHSLAHERAARLRNEIVRLPPSLRYVVEIQQQLDASLEETAQIAALTVAATKSRMLRARAVLRRTMC